MFTRTHYPHIIRPVPTSTPLLSSPDESHHNLQHSPWWLRFASTMASSTWTCPTWNYLCPHCGCSLLRGETKTLYCNNGQKIVPRLPEMPHRMQLMQHFPHISEHSRTLNNLFLFTAIGTSDHFEHFQTGQSNVAVTGRIYHRMLDVTTPDHSIHWFLYNGTDCKRAASLWNVLCNG